MSACLKDKCIGKFFSYSVFEVCIKYPFVTLSLEKEIIVLGKSLEKVLNFGSKICTNPVTCNFLGALDIRFKKIRIVFDPLYFCILFFCSWLYHYAVWPSGRRCFHDGLQLPNVRYSSICCCPEQFWWEVGLWMM